MSENLKIKSLSRKIETVKTALNFVSSQRYILLFVTITERWTFFPATGADGNRKRVQRQRRPVGADR